MAKSPDNKTILVVEDEADMRFVLTERLRQEGFNVKEATNGQEALDLLSHHPVDLILLDLVMPIMDGMEMLRRLQWDEEGKRTKVIILTNSAEDTRMQEALRRGIGNYVIKSDTTIEHIVGLVKDKLS
jgi:Response regulator containing CheY-like receiver, AAA-type ATPase, and DNA-binding domains